MADRAQKLREGWRARQERAAERRRRGVRVYRVELDEVAAEEFLIAGGLLSEHGRDDPAKVEAALETQLGMLIALTRENESFLDRLKIILDRNNGDAV